jgi:hypothetical protein
MGGGLMQLVAYGAQDIYLTGNPQITFFKVVYRRHTNFSMEAIQQTWNGQQNSAGRCTATISRNGDLVHKMYIEVETGSQSVGSYANPGSMWITDVELEIGGQRIDKQLGSWMEAWAELSQSNETGVVACAPGNASRTTGKYGGTTFQRMSGMGGVECAASDTSTKIFVPLQFWFCRNPGLALPLIALQYHEVKVNLNHTIDDVFGTSPTNTLYCDYIYLDTDERRRFAQVSHEYLIEQVQEQSWTGSTTLSNDLNFNHPVKELVWTSNASQVNGFGTDLAGKFKLKLNGHDRFQERDIKYFTRVQVHEYHTGPGGLDAAVLDLGNSASGISALPEQRHADSIAVYSFALKPEEHQPSGTCNFSRIDNAQLSSDSSSHNVDHVYAVNYNVLRIMSGMGGLAYSN